MRVLLKKNKTSNVNEVKEIVDIGYCDEPCLTTGLCMTDMQGKRWIIKGVPKNMCNDICKAILLEGYADLVWYGEYTYLG